MVCLNSQSQPKNIMISFVIVHPLQKMQEVCEAFSIPIGTLIVKHSAVLNYASKNLLLYYLFAESYI